MPFHATVAVPGSKSITNRVLTLAALSRGSSVLRGALWAEDTEVMVDCLQRLGFQVKVRSDPSHGANRLIEVEGQGGVIPKGGTKSEPLNLEVATAGTAARFLTAMVCLGRGWYRLDGSARMRQRPVEDLLEALAQMGVNARSENGNGCFPVLIEARGLGGGTVEVSGEKSSQFASALMLVSGCLAADMTVKISGKRVSEPFLDLTAALMSQAMGREGEKFRRQTGGRECRFEIPAAGYAARDWRIEPDATAASYPLAMAAILGGQARVPHLHAGALQGDIRFWVILREFCGRCVLPQPGEECRLDGPWMWAEDRSLYFAPISDTFITMSVIAPFGQAPLTMKGLAHTRLQESDRLAAVAGELAKTGVKTEILDDDSLRIHPCHQWREAVIDPHNDHRLAMAFAVLGLRDVMGGARPWLRIDNPSCVNKTFPNFFEVLEEAAAQSQLHAGRPHEPVILTPEGQPVYPNGHKNAGQTH